MSQHTGSGSPLARPGLREQIKAIVLQRILDGVYQPGDRIVESQLAVELDVSQAPVRETLRELEAMRLIETQPNKGARVRAVTREELAEAYPVRAALEELAGQLAATRITTEELTAIEQELDAMRHFAVRGALHEQMMHDVRFHQLIVEATGNRLLLDVWNSMHLELRTLITLHHAADDPSTIAEEHAPTLDALRMRDAELTGKHMRHTIEYAHVLFQQATHAQEHRRGRPTNSKSPPPDQADATAPHPGMRPRGDASRAPVSATPAVPDPSTAQPTPGKRPLGDASRAPVATTPRVPNHNITEPTPRERPLGDASRAPVATTPRVPDHNPTQPTPGRRPRGDASIDD